MGHGCGAAGLVGTVLIQPAAWIGVLGLTLMVVVAASLPALGRRGATTCGTHIAADRPLQLTPNRPPHFFGAVGTSPRRMFYGRITKFAALPQRSVARPMPR